MLAPSDEPSSTAPPPNVRFILCKPVSRASLLSPVCPRCFHGAYLLTGHRAKAHVRRPTVLRSSAALVERTRLALPALNWPQLMGTWAIWASAPGKAVHAIFPDHVQLPPMYVQILRASPSVRPKSQKTQSAQGMQSGLQPQFPCCGHQDGTAVHRPVSSPAGNSHAPTRPPTPGLRMAQRSHRAALAHEPVLAMEPLLPARAHRWLLPRPPRVLPRLWRSGVRARLWLCVPVRGGRRRHDNGLTRTGPCPAPVRRGNTIAGRGRAPRSKLPGRRARGGLGPLVRRWHEGPEAGTRGLEVFGAAHSPGRHAPANVRRHLGGSGARPCLSSASRGCACLLPNHAPPPPFEI
jgi:hypothetical protein